MYQIATIHEICVIQLSLPIQVLLNPSLLYHTTPLSSPIQQHHFLLQDIIYAVITVNVGTITQRQNIKNGVTWTEADGVGMLTRKKKVL